MKRISRLWLGPRPMPQEYVEYRKKWRELNPDWQVFDFDWNDLPKLQNMRVINDLITRDDGRLGKELFVQMADVIGYELIYRYGGIYVNCDIEPVRPMSHLLDYYGVDQSAYASLEDDHFIVNAAIGGPAEHPFWRHIINVLPERYFSMPGAEMNHTTGPRLLTDTIYSGGHDIRVLPKEAFNSVHWSQIEFGSDATGKSAWQNDPRVVGVHHWGHRKDRRTNIVENATQ